MTGLDLATCDRALAPGTAPEWVHLLPETGQIKARDGRVFDLVDPAALVLAFEASGIDLPVDYEHQNDRPEARLSGPVPAAGWIKELRSDAGGIWGRVEWTATAANLIARREYRFLSPSFVFRRETGQIIRLKGAGLVHNPALHLVALANQEDTMPPDTPSTDPDASPDAARKSAPLLSRLVKALRLPEGSSEADALDLVTRLVDALTKATANPDDGGADMVGMAAQLAAQAAPDPRRFVAMETVRAMLAERNTQPATMSEERAAAKVADALRKGAISPAMKAWATALCRADEASFDSFPASTPPAFGHLVTPSHTSRAPPGSAADPGCFARGCGNLRAAWPEARSDQGMTADRQRYCRNGTATRQSRGGAGASPVGTSRGTGRGATPLPCPRPPGSKRFQQVPGTDLAAPFLLRLGGAEPTGSENPREDSQLAALLGLDKTRALGGLLHIRRRVPLVKPWLAGYLHAQGYSLAEVARKLHVPDVSVRRWFRQRAEREAERDRR